MTPFIICMLICAAQTNDMVTVERPGLEYFSGGAPMEGVLYIELKPDEILINDKLIRLDEVKSMIDQLKQKQSLTEAILLVDRDLSTAVLVRILNVLKLAGISASVGTMPIEKL